MALKMDARSTRIDPQAWDRWRQSARRGLFEVAIVAVGVFLGLAVNQWQTNQQNRELAQEARTALRAEISANRVSVLARMRRNAALYRDVQAHPEKVADYVFQYRNRTLIFADSAWSSTLDSGALRWLTDEERTKFTGIYGAQRNGRELVVEELSKWSELAAFPQANLTPADVRDRARAIRIWLAYAQRTQAAQCIIIVRYERVLGARFPLDALTDYCLHRRPDEDPSTMYREWTRRGWVSSPQPDS